MTPRLRRIGRSAASRIFAVRRRTSSVRSIPPSRWSSVRYQIRKGMRIALSAAGMRGSGTAPALPVSPPTARWWSQSSLPGTGRAAGTPRSECRAPTSRSPGTGRRCAPRPRRSESARPSMFPVADEEADFELRNPAPGSPEHRRTVAGQAASGLWARTGVPLGTNDERVRDTQSGCTCNSAAADCRAGTCCRHSSHGIPKHRNPCSRPICAGNSISAFCHRRQVPSQSLHVFRRAHRTEASGASRSRRADHCFESSDINSFRLSPQAKFGSVVRPRLRRSHPSRRRSCPVSGRR